MPPKPKTRALKLTDSEVEEIRRRCAAGEKQTDLAFEYNVSTAYISGIHHGRLKPSK